MRAKLATQWGFEPQTSSSGGWRRFWAKSLRGPWKGYLSFAAITRHPAPIVDALIAAGPGLGFLLAAWSLIAALVAVAR